MPINHSTNVRFSTFILVFSLLVFPRFESSIHAENTSDIKLVLQITVDGMRGDLIERYRGGFGEGGFDLLLEEGVVFTNANYQHANTETIVGHATLATGATPSVHGMIGNVWYDRDANELSYNIEDPDALILPSREEMVEGDQVDPSQLVSRTDGRSPRAMLAPTLADALAAYTGGKSKSFGVSGKDRSAVAMAGKVGKAFWISTDTGDFVTSAYYYDEYPEWAKNWNAERQAESYGDKKWELLNDIDEYVLGEQDDRSYEMDLKGFGRTFPHQYAEAGDKLLPTQVVVSPAGDKLCADFAKTIIEAEGLGQNEVPDYLSVSFSGTDAVNHFFGPSSLENEDIVVQLDRTLADFFEFVDEKVGLDKTLIILSADHGMADMAKYMTELGYAAGTVDPDEVRMIANQVGEDVFGIEEVVSHLFRPYMYLNAKKIADAGKEFEDVEQAIATALTNTEGIHLAVPRGGLGALESTPLLEKVESNYHPIRSGDIYIIQEPYWFYFEDGPIAAMHGTPWRYDTHVPLIIAGPDIEGDIIDRLVHPVDIAPTIAAILGITPPAGAEGDPLEEAMPR